MARTKRTAFRVRAVHRTGGRAPPRLVLYQSIANGVRRDVPIASVPASTASSTIDLTHFPNDSTEELSEILWDSEDDMPASDSSEDDMPALEDEPSNSVGNLVAPTAGGVIHPYVQAHMELKKNLKALYDAQMEMLWSCTTDFEDRDYIAHLEVENCKIDFKLGDAM